MKLTTIIGTAIAAGGLAACGSIPVTSTVRPVTAAPRGAATVAPTLVPTPSPTAIPTPAPEPPLALFYTGIGAMEVVNGQGVEQWGLTNAKEGKLFARPPPKPANTTSHPNPEIPTSSSSINPRPPVSTRS